MQTHMQASRDLRGGVAPHFREVWTQVRFRSVRPLSPPPTPACTNRLRRLCAGRQLAVNGGMPRLWRGVSTMFAAAIPAHAAYFSIYEAGTRSLRPLPSPPLALVPHTAKTTRPLGLDCDSTAKTGFGLDGTTHRPFAAAAAGALAVSVHDLVVCPWDVVKQRLQLGYYRTFARSGAAQDWRGAPS